MPTPTTHDTEITRHDIIRCILIAGLITGIADGAFGIAQGVIGGVPSPVARFFQGIAWVIIGKRPMHGGVPGIVLGVAAHFTVALFWSALFAALLSRSRWVRDTLASRGGAFKIAVIYGPIIWTAMSFVVISPLIHRVQTVNSDWWIEFVGHIVSAGLPIALTFRVGALRLKML